MSVQTKLPLDVESELDKQFAAYHKRNPQVYATLVRLARRMRARGRRHIGIKMLWETMRYELMLETTQDTDSTTTTRAGTRG